MKSTVVALFFPLLALAQNISVENPRIRAVPAASKMTAGYLTIRNLGKSERRLVRAQSEVAKSVELHTHESRDGVMQMRQVDEVRVPSEGKAEFMPGGLHLMFIGVSQKLEVGEKHQVHLFFDNEEKKTVLFPVKEVARKMKH